MASGKKAVDSSTSMLCSNDGVPVYSPSRSPPRKTRRQFPIREPLGDIGNISSSFMNAKRAIEVICLEKGDGENGENDLLRKEVNPGVLAKSWWKPHNGPPRRDLLLAKKFYKWATGGNNSDERLV